MDKGEELARIKAAQDAWSREHNAEFQAERKAEFVSLTGIPIKRVYTPLDLEEKGFDYLKAPTKRVASLDIPTPSSSVLEAKFYAGKADIITACLAMLGKR